MICCWDFTVLNDENSPTQKMWLLCFVVNSHIQEVALTGAYDFRWFIHVTVHSNEIKREITSVSGAIRSLNNCSAEVEKSTCLNKKKNKSWNGTITRIKGRREILWYFCVTDYPSFSFFFFSFILEIYPSFVLLFIAISLQYCNTVPQESPSCSPRSSYTIYVENMMVYFLYELLIYCCLNV